MLKQTECRQRATEIRAKMHQNLQIERDVSLKIPKVKLAILSRKCLGKMIFYG